MRSSALLAALSAVAVALLAASCGSSAEDGCARYVEVVCEKQAACNPHDFMLLYGQEAGECGRRRALSCPTIVALPASHVGRDAMGQCADELSDVSCEQWNANPFPDSCKAALRGDFAPGTSCVHGTQCDSGVCGSKPLNFADYTCDKCQELFSLGDECSDKKGICEAGLRCDKGHCVAEAAREAPCDNVNACADGLSCIGGVCAPHLPVGAACTDSSECNLANAELCICVIENNACANGSCTAYPDAYWDGTCGVGAFQTIATACRAGFYCDFKPNGEGRCKPQFLEGDGCIDSGQCTSPAECVEGTCEIPLPPSCP